MFGELAHNCIKKIENASHGEYITSALTIYEVLIIIVGLTGKRLKDKSLVEGVIDSITHLRGLIIHPLKHEDLVQAIALMGDYDLDYEDSLHLSIALRTRTKEIISNDKDFDKTPLTRKF